LLSAVRDLMPGGTAFARPTVSAVQFAGRVSEAPPDMLMPTSLSSSLKKCRYNRFMAREVFIMTTISTTTPSVQSGSSGRSSSSASSDIASQIQSLTQQVTKLTKQLKEIASGSGTTEEKKKQQELIQDQIKMLQAQIAQLQRRQAEEAQKNQEQKQAKAEGVNSPSAEHKIDIYI